MYVCIYIPFTCNVVFSSYLQNELLYSTPSPKLRAQFLFGLNIPNFRIVNKFCSQPFTMFKLVLSLKKIYEIKQRTILFQDAAHLCSFCSSCLSRKIL